MSKGTTINVSEFSRDVLKALKKRKEHKNYDSVLREILHEAGLNEEELVAEVRDDGMGSFDASEYK